MSLGYFFAKEKKKVSKNILRYAADLLWLPQTSKLRNSSLRYDETAGYGSLGESKKGSNVQRFFCIFFS
jgi:hypothetical protein